MYSFHQRFTLRYIAASAILLIVTIALIQRSALAPYSVDLLEGNWKHMPGVTQTNTGLMVRKTNVRMHSQNLASGEENIPLNLYGTHLTATGDVVLKLDITDLSNDATIVLLGQPIYTADEFRYALPNNGGISLSLNPNTVTTSLLPSNASTTRIAFSQKQQHAITPATTYHIRIEKDAKHVAIWLNQQQIARYNTSSALLQPEIWFGLSSQAGHFTVSRLEAATLKGGHIAAINTERNVAATAKRPMAKTATRTLVGTAVSLAPLVSDETYYHHATTEFSSWTIENEMKPQYISPQPGQYEFAAADAIIAIARQNNIVVHGHTIAFGEALPDWMRDLPTGTEAEREASRQQLLAYVSTVANHYKDSLVSLDVINEPLDRNGGAELDTNIWLQAFGPNYAEVILRTVHQAAPNIKLYVNENGTEQAGSRQDAFLAYVQQLKQANTPLDGIGLQSHIYDFETDALDAQELNSYLERLDKIGLDVRISELDVTDERGSDMQAVQYGTVASSCLKAQNCTAITTWGIDDAYDWFLDDDGTLQQGNDLLFNQGRPTKAYREFMEALRTK